MDRVNFDNLRPRISRVNSRISIETHTPAEGILVRRWCSDATDARNRRWLTWRENAAGTTEPVRERSDRAWPRVLAVTVSEWRLHVSLCGAFHVLIVRLSVSPFGRARTERLISPTPRRRPLLVVKTLRGTYGDDLWEKRHHEEDCRDEDDAGTISLRENLAGTRVKVKAEATMPDGSVATLKGVTIKIDCFFDTLVFKPNIV